MMYEQVLELVDQLIVQGHMTQDELATFQETLARKLLDNAVTARAEEAAIDAGLPWPTPEVDVDWDERLTTAFTALFDVKDNTPVGRELFRAAAHAIDAVKELAFVADIELPRRFDAERTVIT